MKIGYIGLGKLGLPCAVAIAEKGHTIYGYDANEKAIASYKKGTSHLYEPDMDRRLKKALPAMKFVDSIDEVIVSSEITFVAVQTPHPPELDGSVRHHHVRKDFDYTYLLKAARDIAGAVNHCRPEDYKVIAIISTVLHGKTRRLVYPARRHLI